jgi:uncharacterized protein YecT (DUF1311 family)
MKLQIWLFAVGLTLTASSSWSAEQGLSADYSHCEARAKGEAPALMDCLDAEFKRQDARLNGAYKALLAKVSPKKADELRKVQRAWLTYVEGECGFLYDADDFSGSSDRLTAQSCQVEERARRADSLEALARH